VDSDKQLILIILVWVVVFGYQYYKDEKKKQHDEKLQRHLSKYFDSKW
jgi:predicted negative regulator of RcsB-dependent stress response